MATENNNHIFLKAVIRDALRYVPTRDVVTILHVLTDALELLCYHSKNSTLHTFFQESGLQLPHRSSLFSSIDLVWQAICSECPDVYAYPLGDINERDLKSTIGIVITATVPTDLHKRRFVESLIKRIEALLSITDSGELYSAIVD